MNVREQEEMQADQKWKLRQIWSNLDGKGNGQLSQDEFISGVEDLMQRCFHGHVAEAGKVQFVFEEMDADRDGLIDYEHFIRAVEKDETLLSLLGISLANYDNNLFVRRASDSSSRPLSVELSGSIKEEEEEEEAEEAEEDQFHAQLVKEIELSSQRRRRRHTGEQKTTEHAPDRFKRPEASGEPRERKREEEKVRVSSAPNSPHGARPTMAHVYASSAMTPLRDLTYKGRGGDRRRGGWTPLQLRAGERSAMISSPDSACASFNFQLDKIRRERRIVNAASNSLAREHAGGVLGLKRSESPSTYVRFGVPEAHLAELCGQLPAPSPAPPPAFRFLQPPAPSPLRVPAALGAPPAAEPTRRGGVGMLLDWDNKGTFTVKDLVRGHAASKQGSIARGDELVAVDGKPIMGMDLEGVAGLLGGVEGSVVTLSMISAAARASGSKVPGYSVQVIRQAMPEGGGGHDKLELRERASVMWTILDIDRCNLISSQGFQR
ncbi:hypothetical protein GUITHDRAFT_142207 [Guillardia theta CCMP2712]|uniref:PDZ domain-containing protein n=1 Tax=Guillardia theta (strain CCMP2712) TaxID=905079 RepID=L1IXR8_GUITC|nr:hypothetical protein GUITHDRAFT_142207 [Guillardia theta CCMP2712]EKX41031.1 hypothetical protein GUITHDRAFT_142207 [Guillardia theta CCMP2712]|eukprot:XP_005828011.1 hypothetical protein GUITHDRAFT_142207 [Guillardia theta CCMP2712]